MGGCYSARERAGPTTNGIEPPSARLDVIATIRFYPFIVEPETSCVHATSLVSIGMVRRCLVQLTGTWSIVSTMCPQPGAEPVVTRDITADPVMIGSLLQETMRPAANSGTPDFRRLDYLDFDRVEGRWNMCPDKIVLHFQPPGFVGLGREVEGRFMVSDMRISSQDKNHVIKEQHVTMADGTARTWRFVHYEYMRLR